MAELPPGVTWTQDEDSVEVTVAVPETAVRGDLRVQTTADTLAVQMRSSADDGATAWRPVVTGKLRHDVERESCCWALEKMRKGGGKAVVIQLEKVEARAWDALLRASVEGSILQELGRDQVIVDAGASTSESVTCGRCGALVKASRMEAHVTMWCDALAAEGGSAGEAGGASAAKGDVEEGGRSASSHLYWSRTPTNPAGSAPPRRISPAGGHVGAEEEGELI